MSLRLVIICFFMINLFPQYQEIKIAKNTNQPIYTKTKSTFKLKFTIENNLNEPEYKILAPISLTVDRYNNLYVLDAAYNNIKKYNSKGEHILTFGKRGDEDGEFQSPRNIYFNGRFILVLDPAAGRINYFTTEGKFKQFVELQEFDWLPVHFSTYKNHFLIGGNPFRNERDHNSWFVSFNNKGEAIDTLFQGEMNYYKSDKKVFLNFIRNNDGFYLFDYSARKDFVIEKYDIKGKLQTVIIKEATPIEYEQDELPDDYFTKTLALMPGFSYPDYKNFIYFAWVDNAGNLCISSRNEEGDGVDIFSSDGKYLARLPYKVETRSFYLNGYIYQIEYKSKNSNPVISVYTLNYKLKK